MTVHEFEQEANIRAFVPGVHNGFSFMVLEGRGPEYAGSLRLF